MISLLPPALPESLNVLIARITAGDRAALRTLYSCLCDIVCGEVRRVPLNAHDTQAAVYATFVEVWWLARFHTHPGADIPTWITMVAGQRATEQLRLSTTPGHGTRPLSYEEDRNRVALAGLLGQAIPAASVVDSR